MRIWDLHCHLPSERFSSTGLHGQIEDFLRVADRVGIERLCVFLYVEEDQRVGPPPVEGRLYLESEEIRRSLVRHRDRISGFLRLNPSEGTKDEPSTDPVVQRRAISRCLDQMERWIADGPMVGIKLHSLVKFSDPIMEPIILRAAELRAAIFQHTWFKSTGNNPRESTPLDVAAVAARHPGIPLMCGHTGGDWELGIRAVRPHANVFIDLGGAYQTEGIVEMAVRELGAERVLFGSDAPGRSFASQLAKVHGADVSDEAKRLIFAENLRRLLAPIHQSKGIDV